MTAYYNEIDPYAAQWLRNLIAAGHIAPGDVDERSITDVLPSDLLGYTQCHFFAGIGIWSHALRRAGWDDDRPIWTGSCPCQPFSAAGKQKGFDDERHLWPVWANLIRECRPPVVLGEQVASALDWLDLVSTDLETADYAFGAASIPAAGFGGAHIRQRLYWIASDTMRVGASRFGNPKSFVESRQGRSLSPMDLREIIRSPFSSGDGYSQPILRAGIDETSARVGRLRAYGNGLDAETATQFCAAVMECLP